MTKKVFILVISFLMIIFTSSIIFAEENMSTEWDDSIDKTKNTMQNTFFWKENQLLWE